MARTKPVKILPGVPSTLIRLAVEDLAWVLTQKNKYRVDMETWYEPGAISQEDWDKIDSGLIKRGEAKRLCSVCFGGSVMARTMGNGGDIKDEDSYGPLNALRFRALNMFRQGGVVEGMHEMGIDDGTFPEDANGAWVYYQTVRDGDWLEFEHDTPSKARFIAQMKRMARAFEQIGL